MSHHPGKFTWFEHMSNDIEKARTFYEGLFGWQVKPLPHGDKRYDMIHNGEQSIAGLYAAPPGVPNQWISYVSVADVDATFAAALAAGAKPLMAPADFPGNGRGATVLDAAGAPVSLWHGLRGDRDDVEHVPAGDWVWNELNTADPKAALAFYEKVFGYTHDRMDLGAQGTYYVLKGPDGKGRAGIATSPAGTRAMWTPYVNVEDADKTAAKVAPLGGKLVLQPQDVPGAGRLAALLDPMGASIAFIRPNPAA